MTLRDAVKRIEDMTPYTLAGLMEHAPVSLDGKDSPGARFLVQVRDEVVEQLTKDPANLDSDEWYHEAADVCVPSYTYEAWKTFVDLVGWGSAHAQAATELTTESAQGVLYDIGADLLRALLHHVRDELENYDDDLDEYDYQDYVGSEEETAPNAGSAS